MTTQVDPGSAAGLEVRMIVRRYGVRPGWWISPEESA
jgi:hypothetical protein